MELYQLKTFVAVAKEGHLTRAAKSLHTSQPAVSAHIKALEAELEIALFDRTPKGMDLTAAGKRLLDQAQTILERALGGCGAYFNVQDASHLVSSELNSSPLSVSMASITSNPAPIQLVRIFSITSLGFFLSSTTDTVILDHISTR